MTAAEIERELIATMEKMLLASFPPLETEHRDGVTVGRAHGVTGRANSAIVLDQVADVAGTTAWASDWLRQRSCAPLFRLSPLAPQALVDALGPDSYNVTTCMHLDLRQLPTAARDETVEIVATRPGDWISERDSDGQHEVTALMNNVDGDVAWALVRGDDGPAAAGRGVLVDGWLCIQGMYTEPEARGQGAATAVLGQLHRWALTRGATDAFLNVLATNEVAQSIYRRRGYRSIYDYRYVSV